MHDFIYSMYVVKCQYTSYVHINMNVDTHTLYMKFVRHNKMYIRFILCHTQVIDSVIRFFRLSRALLCTIFPRFDISINECGNELKRERNTHFPVCSWVFVDKSEQNSAHTHGKHSMLLLPLYFSFCFVLNNAVLATMQLQLQCIHVNLWRNGMNSAGN